MANQIVVLRDVSFNASDSGQDGGSTSTGRSDTETATQGTSETTGDTETTRELAEIVTRARGRQAGSSSSTANARGTTETSGTNWARTKSQGRGVTYKQTLIPRIRTRNVVTAIQYFTTEEQFTEAASDLTGLQRGECFFYVGGKGVVRVRIPALRDPFSRLPRCVARKLTELREQIQARPEFETPENLLLARRDFARRLLRLLEQLPLCEPAAFEALPSPVIEADGPLSI